MENSNESLSSDFMLNSLKERNDIISKHIEFLRYTKSDELMVIFLKAHLFFENEINRMLLTTFFTRVYLNNKTFAAKLILVNSMGMINGFYNVVNEINTYRNKYAHNLYYNFSEDDYKKIFYQLSEQQQNSYNEMYSLKDTVFYENFTSMSDFNFKVQLLFFYVWMNVDILADFVHDNIKVKLMEAESNSMKEYLNEKAILPENKQ